MMDEVYENLVTISFAIEISAIIIFVIDDLTPMLIGLWNG